MKFNLNSTFDHGDSSREKKCKQILININLDP